MADAIKQIKVGQTLHDVGVGSINLVDGLKEELNNKANATHSHSYAPTSHASSATTYGVGTTANYGHVKISNGDVATTASANGLAAGMDHSHSNYLAATPTRNGHTAHFNTNGYQGSIGSGGTEDIYQINFLIRLMGNALYFGSAVMFYPNYNCNWGDENYMTDINLIVSTKCTIDADMGKVDAWVEGYMSSSNGTPSDLHVVLDGSPYGTDTGNYSEYDYYIV